jgi:peptide/nickel transport system permease protein
VIVGVLVFVFFMVQMVGDPVRLMLPGDVPQDVYLRMKEALGFNDPVLVRFGRELTGWLHGDFGISLWQGTAALPLALHRIPNTLFLTVVSLSIAIPLALGLGMYSAVKPNSIVDRILTASRWRVYRWPTSGSASC